MPAACIQRTARVKNEKEALGLSTVYRQESLLAAE